MILLKAEVYSSSLSCCMKPLINIFFSNTATYDHYMQIMGYKSYAEFALKDNMASSPEVVLSFLHQMSNMVRNKAEEV